MTKVLPHSRSAVLALTLCAITHVFVFAAETVNPGTERRSGESLYLELGQVSLDPKQVYKVRDVSVDRPSIHISLEDGTIAFTQDVMGHITGAFFEGEGEILLTPPNEVERNSLALFTGMAILEERFGTAYFRFNDDTAAEMKPGLRASDNTAEFVSRWASTARNLAQADAMRLLASFSPWLPVAGNARGENEQPTLQEADRMFHARLQGLKLGVFDVYYDTSAEEQVEVGQSKTEGNSYYDVWTSFSVTSAPGSGTGPSLRPEDAIAIRRYKISTDVTPPKLIHGDAELEIEVKQGGQRMLLFELSRFLRVERVELDRQAVEFINNPAMEGTQLSRRGNDMVAVILPRPAQAGQKMVLRFVYGGEVLAEAGVGLLYVGARGTWYPNRGMAMADYDLEFRYPPGWTLVATGKPVSLSPSESMKAQPEQVSRWISDRPIPVAGFNLGRYKMASTRANEVRVQAYAAETVERAFPTPPMEVVHSGFDNPGAEQKHLQIVVPQTPSPASKEAAIAQAASQAIAYYAARFGPFPYSQLSITQMPGRESQGWPGLIFLSSYAFLAEPEGNRSRQDSTRTLLEQQIPAHETAHQWWGDLVMWSSYRDQWFSEGLANYCSLMMLQETNPVGFRQILERYKRDLVEKNKEGLLMKDDGPVSLGTRLWSSRFPEGYEAVSYGRGTWLFHMLRTMLQDGAVEERQGRAPAPGADDELFVRALRKLRERYQGKAITTAELFEMFAEELPPALRYDGKKSLQWFIDGWVNGTALPKLELKGVKMVAKGQSVVVTGTIMQKEAPEDLVTSVPVYARRPNRPPVLLGRVFADGEESNFRLTAPLGTQHIVLDPNESILTAPK